MLARLVGDEAKAIGLCVEAWFLAQRYWSNERLVPLKLWELGGFGPLIEVDLAEVRDEGVYCRGSERFDWIADKQSTAAAAGRASAAARKSKYGTAVPPNASNSQVRAEQPPNETEQPPNETEQPPNETERPPNGPNACSARSAEQTEQPPNEPPNDDRAKPNALAPALAPALALSPLIPPSAPPERRQGATRRDMDREADEAAGEVLAALEKQWPPERMERELPVLASLLVAKRYGKPAVLVDRVRRLRTVKELEVFAAGLRNDFRGLRPALSSQGPPRRGEEQSKQGDMLNSGGATDE